MLFYPSTLIIQYSRVPPHYFPKYVRGFHYESTILLWSSLQYPNDTTRQHCLPDHQRLFESFRPVGQGELGFQR